MASLQVTEIFADTERQADYLFGEHYLDVSLLSTEPPDTAVIRRTCPVGSHQIVTDLAGLRAHIYSKHKITITPRPRPRAYSWA